MFVCKMLWIMLAYGNEILEGDIDVFWTCSFDHF